MEDSGGPVFVSGLFDFDVSLQNSPIISSIAVLEILTGIH